MFEFLYESSIRFYCRICLGSLVFFTLAEKLGASVTAPVVETWFFPRGRTYRGVKNRALRSLVDG